MGDEQDKQVYLVHQISNSMLQILDSPLSWESKRQANLALMVMSKVRVILRPIRMTMTNQILGVNSSHDCQFAKSMIFVNFKSSFLRILEKNVGALQEYETTGLKMAISRNPRKMS